MTYRLAVDKRTVLAMVAMALSGSLASCSWLGNKPAPHLQTYTLSEAATPNGSSTSLRDSIAASKFQHSGWVLLVETPRAAAGYNSAHMVYVRHPQTQEVYARSVWVDTPARMLAPLLVAHLQQSGLFRAVLQAPSGAQAGLRLDTTVIRLQQDFLQVPSRTHVEWQLNLMNHATREVLASHRIHVERVAPSDDAAGGVRAANVATQEALRQTTVFLQDAVSALPPQKPRSDHGID